MAPTLPPPQQTAWSSSGDSVPQTPHTGRDEPVVRSPGRRARTLTQTPHETPRELLDEPVIVLREEQVRKFLAHSTPRNSDS